MRKVKTETRKNAFTSIYKQHYWGDKNLSGAGSSLDATSVTRDTVLNIVRQYDIKSIVDVACGDFVWMPLVLKELNNTVDYTGCDIVDHLVTEHQQAYPDYTFQNLDFVEAPIPQVDRIICLDALPHLPVPDIIKALNNFSNSGAKYLLATTHLRRFGLRNRMNIRPGRCRDRNLMLAPFNLPNPIVIYSEQHQGYDKFLGLWSLPF